MIWLGADAANVIDQLTETLLDLRCIPVQRRLHRPAQGATDFGDTPF